MSEHNITVGSGSTVRLKTAGKYCDRDIVVAATGGTEDLETVLNEQETLIATLQDTLRYKGSSELDLQEKTVTPTQSQQIITADSGYGGLKKVVVNPIPDDYAQNVKRWDVTIENGSPTDGSAIVYFLKNQKWLMENQTNPNLCVIVLPKFMIQYDPSISLIQGVYVQTNFPMMANHYGTQQYSLSAYVNSSGGIVARMRDRTLTNGNNFGDIFVTVTGGLYAIATEGAPVAAGEYTVIAYIA